MITMQASRPLYYFLVTILTQFILAIGAMLILAPTGLLAHLPLELLGGLLAYNVAVATLVAAIMAGKVGPDEGPVQRGAGLVLGHLVGLMLGGFLGAHYGGALWALVGAVTLYFVVGWIGSRISLAIGNELDRLASATTEPPTLARAGKANSSFVFFYGAVVPLFLMTAAMLLKTSNLPLAQYPHILPTARMVLIVLSLFSILIPRLRRTQALKHAHELSHDHLVPMIGLGLSLAPAFYGFLLFIGFGMSMGELSLFSTVAAIAATTWGVGVARRI